MSRKFIIVLVITTLFTALVVCFSWIYLSQLLRQRLLWADETASQLTNQMEYAASKAVPDLTSTRVDTNNPKAMRAAVTKFLQTDANLNDMLESVVGNSRIVYDAAIIDPNGVAILDTNPALNGKPVPERPRLGVLRDASFRRQLRLLYAPSTVYDVSIGLELDGQAFGSVRVGVSTVFLRNELTPKLQQAAFFSVLAIFCSLVLGAVVSNVALGPLKVISRNLDSASAGDLLPDEETSAGDEVGLVSLKIAHLGRQIRDTNQIFSALKDNVEQVMTKLQDGLMLFTRDTRVVLVSASAEKFLGRPRREILGRTAEEIFSDGSVLGAVVLPAFQKQRPLVQYEFDAVDRRRVQVSLDFIQEKGTPIGALLTMRDAESVRRIENDIEMSRRLSASGRLTRGVAHEVKNPINAIVLHLQLLQNKLQQDDPETRRHMDVIGNEIHRLDRVVQILVDFTRPRDLHLEDVDLRKILESVAALAAPDAARHGVRLVQQLPSQPELSNRGLSRQELPNEDVPHGDDALMVRADSDLMKQAILNLVINGVQAMTAGGTLTLKARRDGETILAEVLDQGCGIPPEAQEKIFELYFTTKGGEGGSGIGLAQTYQIMQWHYGSVEFDSIVGAGTTFRLRLPAAAAKPESREEITA
ncbi:MAG TPA: ATP-binding protein [Terriglobales bacterium]|jgi:PAS domain S-box-containing protein|nr:ATP-binding protein [Terriglobales bacterium]